MSEAIETAIRLKALAEKATAKPWSTKRPEGETNGFAHGVVVAATAPGASNRVYADPPGGSFPSADQAFIVAVRNDAETVCDALIAAADRIKELEAALGPADGPDEDRDLCIACNVALKEGDEYYPDESGGSLHAKCCGPERECYTLDGEPLKDGDPIPTPYIWSRR